MPPTDTPPPITPERLELIKQRLAAHLDLVGHANVVLAKPPAERTQVDLAILRGLALAQMSAAIDVLQVAVVMLEHSGATAAAMAVTGVKLHICKCAEMVPSIAEAPAVVEGVN